MTLWLTVFLSLILCAILITNKRFSKLHLVIVYTCGTAAISCAYNFFFHNWYFYLYANNVVGSMLFALAYWDVAKKLENKNLIFILLAAAGVPIVLFLPVLFLTKVYLPYFIVDVAIAFTLPFALRARNPILIIWSVASFWDVAFDAIKLYVPESEALVILRNIDIWTKHISFICIIGVIVWKPVTRWILQQLPGLQKSQLSLVQEEAGRGPLYKPENHAESSALAELHSLLPEQKNQSVDSPRTEGAEDDMDALNPVLKTAAMMLTLNHKPYLTQEEAMFYLDLNEAELENFLGKYEVKKIYLTGNDDKWVVRREEVERINN